MAGRKAVKHITASTRPFAEAVRFVCLQLVRTEDDKWRTKLEVIAEQLVRQAMAGDLDAIKQLAVYLDGRAPTFVVNNSTTNVTVGAAISELNQRRMTARDAVQLTVQETPRTAIEHDPKGSALG